MPSGKVLVVCAVAAMLITGTGKVVRGVKKLAPKVKHAVVKVVDHQK